MLVHQKGEEGKKKIDFGALMSEFNLEENINQGYIKKMFEHFS